MSDFVFDGERKLAIFMTILISYVNLDLLEKHFLFDFLSQQIGRYHLKIVGYCSEKLLKLNHLCITRTKVVLEQNPVERRHLLNPNMKLDRLWERTVFYLTNSLWTIQEEDHLCQTLSKAFEDYSCFKKNENLNKLAICGMTRKKTRLMLQDKC